MAAMTVAAMSYPLEPLNAVTANTSVAVSMLRVALMCFVGLIGIEVTCLGGTKCYTKLYLWYFWVCAKLRSLVHND